ncbi:MAG: RskA family anti-sigma factor [Streptosporangiaceae bacterium]
MRDDLHVLSGSYALDALSEPERDSFERHLQHCSLCEDEVRGLRETAARLGLAKTLDPPPQLRSRVLAAALAAASLVVVVVLGITQAMTRHQPGGARRPDRDHRRAGRRHVEPDHHPGHRGARVVNRRVRRWP